MSPTLAVTVRKQLAGVRLDATFHANAGALVLFGPSGAGKTTILNCIAGLVRPDDGRIALDKRVLFARERGRTLVDVPARQRRVGYVMQDYALFPHMSALANVAYPMRRARDASANARELMRLLSVEQHAEQFPTHLSGGQQQRVAIARALATRSPVLLLDEPFAALDAPVRSRLQRDLLALQRHVDLVLILVTHSLEDAFAIGDRIAVLQDGQVVQAGRVCDVFRKPATSDVAEILGIRNLFRASVLSPANPTLLDWNGLHVEVSQPTEALQGGGEVVAFIRPDDVKILYPDRPLPPSLAHNAVDATIIDRRDTAVRRALHLLLPNAKTIEAHLPVNSYQALELSVGATTRISLRREGFVIVGNVADSEAEMRIARADRP